MFWIIIFIKIEYEKIKFTCQFGEKYLRIWFREKITITYHILYFIADDKQ